MLKNKDIEAVSVCTWSTYLAEEANKALDAGKHVLVEKPMATNSKQHRNSMNLPSKTGYILTVGFLSGLFQGCSSFVKP